MSLQSSHHWVRRLTKGLIHGGLIVWSLVCLFPIYWVTVTSFKDVYIIDKAPTYIPFVDFTPSLDAWRFILLDANENLTSRAANSVIIGIFSTLSTMVIGGMAVYGLTRLVPKVSAVGIMTFILCSRILPPVTLALPLYFMAQFTGTRDSLGFLIFVYTAVNLPIAVWMLAPVFGSKATEQEEAAQIDGASHMYIFFHVLLPMVRTAMITVGLLVFLQCWNEYLFAVYLTSDHALTVPPWMVGQLSMKEAQVGGGAEEWAHLSAATVVMVLPALIFTIFAQRFLGQAFVARSGAK
jgi:multiple sugar transport system permease protein